MSSPLREHQHELTDLTESNGIVFGTDDTGYLTSTYPTITQGDVASNDVVRPQEDGIAFGRDYRGAKTYGFEFHVLTDETNRLGYVDGRLDPHRANLDALDLLESRWTAPEWRSNPTAVAVLRSCAGGRVSRCYGRPRRWDEAAGQFTQQGWTPVVADFQLVDNHWYGDIEEMAQIHGVVSHEGGVIAPIVAPITTTLSSQAQTVEVDVGGNAPTWMIVEFYGGLVSNPILTIDGDTQVGYTGALAAGESVIIDPRPWNRSVVRYPDGAGVAGRVSHRSPMLRNMLLSPGRHVIGYRASDPDGRSYARLKWRTARTRP